MDTSAVLGVVLGGVLKLGNYKKTQKSLVGSQENRTFALAKTK